MKFTALQHLSSRSGEGKDTCTVKTIMETQFGRVRVSKDGKE